MNENTQWSPSVDILNLTSPFSCQVRHIPIKRGFDILFSLIVMIISCPALFLIGLIVRLTSKGPVIYYQERIGRGGAPFRCYKFRTMHPDADKRLKDILKNDKKKQEEWNKNHKLKNDPRVTFVGAFLRKTSIDEFPQFFNVLKGDLSVVGPRPVVHEEIVKHIGCKAHKILSVRPGITGIWQVSGRSDTSYETRIALDEKYIDTRNFMLDMKLIALTIPSMLSSKGAY